MVSKPVRAALFIMVALCFSLGYSQTNAQARNVAERSDFPAFYEKANLKQSRSLSLTAVVYDQPHDASGTLIQSSRWDPGGSDSDQWVWDNFTLPSDHSITEIHWRGGYDPTYFGSGGSVIDFRVAIYASIPAGTQPDVINPPLVEYLTGGNAGETLVGLFGGAIKVSMYDYAFTLPIPFQAVAGTKYWVHILALQHGSPPDWGLAAGTGGNGGYFRKIHSATQGYIYQSMQGDTAFSLLGPWVANFWVHLPFVVH